MGRTTLRFPGKMDTRMDTRPWPACPISLARPRLYPQQMKIPINGPFPRRFPIKTIRSQGNFLNSLLLLVLVPWRGKTKGRILASGLQPLQASLGVGKYHPGRIRQEGLNQPEIPPSRRYRSGVRVTAPNPLLWSGAEKGRFTRASPLDRSG